MIGMWGVAEGNGSTNSNSFTTYAPATALMPTVAITDVVIRTISGNALITGGVDELQVYTLATS
jgi:hypothetical protein